MRNAFQLPIACLLLSAALLARGGESWHVTPGTGLLLTPGGDAGNNWATMLRLGYDFDAPLSLELGGLIVPRDGRNEISGTWVDTVVHLARWERFDPFLNAGVGAFWSDCRALPDDRARGLAPRLGAGFLYTLSEHWSLRAGITVQTLQPSARRAGFGILDTGLSYYFGDTTPTRPDAAN